MGVRVRMAEISAVLVAAPLTGSLLDSSWDLQKEKWSQLLKWVITVANYHRFPGWGKRSNKAGVCVVVVSTTDLRARRAPFWWCRQPCRHRPGPCYAQMPPSSSSPW
eukprot:COSAG01_NODE_2705_length_7221_cov_80.513760_3_plen_107_part_00